MKLTGYTNCFIVVINEQTRI